MPNVFSKPEISKVAEQITNQVKLFPPAMYYMKSAKALKKREKTYYREFEMLFDPEKINLQKCKKSLPVLDETGDAETWCKWRTNLQELYRLVPLKTGAERSKAVESLLRGKAMDYYTVARSKATEKVEAIVARTLELA